jgi:hypothetical protein
MGTVMLSVSWVLALVLFVLTVTPFFTSVWS